MLSSLDVPLYEIADSKDCEMIKKDVDDYDAIIDALLGVGAKGQVREPVKSLISLINSLKCKKISVDVPSGDNETKVHADTILALHTEKVAGSKVVDIGIPPEAEHYCGPGDVYLALPEREPSAHKGDYGRLLVVGGSKSYVGTPVLVAQGALRAGVDLATICCPQYVSERMPYNPNLIIRPLRSKNHLTEDDLDVILEQNFDVMVVGNGLGVHDDTKYALRELVKKIDKPTVVDADALRLLELKHLTSNMILTPHSAEFKSLFGEYEEKEKVKTVEGYSRKTETTILLKGATDVISNGETTKLNKTGNPAMTVGGTGDVLAGIVGGLTAQNNSPLVSCCAGAFLNGLSGDLACEELGVSLTATDVIDYIPYAIAYSKKYF
jgi:NAD(P)H-hydrate epimerase